MQPMTKEEKGENRNNGFPDEDVVKSQPIVVSSGIKMPVDYQSEV